jgi:ABC-2 type transport system permease protein
MSPRILRSTTQRIVRQLRHDRRTIALMLLVPPLLLTLIYSMWEDQEQLFDRLALTMLGIFPFLIMFLLTSIAVLRERTSGTLERLFTTPLGKLDLLFGYGIAFGLVAAIQATVATGFAYWVLDLDTAGNTWLVVLIAVTNAVLGVALGLFCSAFARTEFQAVQFMPVVVLPQILLCGLFVPRNQMAGWLEGLSNALPMSYSVEALLQVGQYPDPTDLMWRDLGIVAGVVVLALLLGATTLRRRTA